MGGAASAPAGAAGAVRFSRITCSGVPRGEPDGLVLSLTAECDGCITAAKQSTGRRRGDSQWEWEDETLTLPAGSGSAAGATATLRVRVERPPAAAVAAPTVQGRASKALLIGICYQGSPWALPGCTADAEAVRVALPALGFGAAAVRVMRDDKEPSHEDYPSRAAVLSAMRWLLGGAAEGDCLLVYFSGHGRRKRDSDGDEDDGFDETIVPADFHDITDDELHEHLVRPLPAGARLTFICDSSHSGTVLDLPHRVTAAGRTAVRGRPGGLGDVVQLSACQDSGTAESGGSGGGVLTSCLLTALRRSPTPTFGELPAKLQALVSAALSNGRSQEPMLACSKPLPLSEPFSLLSVTPSTARRSGGSARAAKALVVGISYQSSPWALPGSLKDTRTYVDFLARQGFAAEEMRVLTDDRDPSSLMYPSRENMLASMRWLVEGAKPGDCLFFSYSGHGRQKADTSADELDGQDETIVPADFQDIIDDTIFDTLVRGLPVGARLLVVCDCCNSGTMMDLPHTISIQENELRQARGRKDTRASMATGDVIQLSACRDAEQAVDFGNGVGGALTAVVMESLARDPHPPIIALLRDLSDRLRARLGPKCQVPVVSSSRMLSATDRFELLPGAPRRPGELVASGEVQLPLKPGRISVRLTADAVMSMFGEAVDAARAGRGIADATRGLTLHLTVLSADPPGLYTVSTAGCSKQVDAPPTATAAPCLSFALASDPADVTLTCGRLRAVAAVRTIQGASAGGAEWLQLRDASGQAAGAVHVSWTVEVAAPPPAAPTPATAVRARAQQLRVMRVVDVRGLKVRAGSLAIRVEGEDKRFGDPLPVPPRTRARSLAVEIVDAHRTDGFIGAALVALDRVPLGPHWLPLLPRRDSAADHELYFTPPEGLGEVLIVVENANAAYKVWTPLAPQPLAPPPPPPPPWDRPAPRAWPF